MAKLALKKASTDVSVYLFAQASNVTTGAGLTGLAYNTADLVASYVRPLGSRAAITLATQTVTGEHSDGGFVEVDATNMPGVYRLDLPDAVCATGVPSAVVMLKGATNLAPVLLEIQLTDFDLNTAAITAAGIADAVLDEALSGHTGAGSLGKAVSDTLADTGTDGVLIGATQGAITWGQQKIVANVAGEGALDIYNSNSSGVGQHNKGGSSSAGLWNEATIGTLNDGGSIGLVNSGVKAVDGFDPALALEATLTAIKGAGWTNETLAKIVLDISNISAGSGATPQQIWEYATRVLTAGTNIDLSSLATATDLATLDGKADAILEDTGTTIPATLTTIDNFIDTEVAAILEDTGTTIPATLATLATSAALATVDTNVDSILADTDELQAELADGGRTDLLIDAIKAKTDTIAAAPTVDAIADGVWDEAISGHTTATTFGGKNQKVVPSETINDYKADVSSLATAAALDTIDNFIDTEITTIDGIVDAIKVKTDLIPASPAQAGEYTAAIGAIPTSPLLAANYTAPDNAGIAAIQAKTDQMVFTTPNKIDATATVDTSGLATSTALATVDGNVDAIKVKTDQMAFTVPNKIDASATVDPTGIATSEELEIIGDKVDGVLDKLNVSSVSFVTSVVGSTITVHRGDTLDDDHLLNIGDLTDYVSIDFTVKRSTYEADDDAIIHIRKNASGTGDGLLRLNGAAHSTGTDGSIVIDDLATGDITPNLKATITDDLVPGSYVYDCQVIKANSVKTKTSGGWVVSADVTRLVA